MAVAVGLAAVGSRTVRSLPGAMIRLPFAGVRRVISGTGAVLAGYDALAARGDAAVARHRPGLRPAPSLGERSQPAAAAPGGAAGPAVDVGVLPSEIRPADPAGAGLPVPDYDGLSLAALRARLRHLDASQLARLRDHERTHTIRLPVLNMLEARIARLVAQADGKGNR